MTQKLFVEEIYADISGFGQAFIGNRYGGQSLHLITATRRMRGGGLAVSGCGRVGPISSPKLGESNV
jgi:hypothetical protein